MGVNQSFILFHEKTSIDKAFVFTALLLFTIIYFALKASKALSVYTSVSYILQFWSGLPTNPLHTVWFYNLLHFKCNTLYSRYFGNNKIMTGKVTKNTVLQFSRGKHLQRFLMKSLRFIVIFLLGIGHRRKLLAVCINKPY